MSLRFSLLNTWPPRPETLARLAPLANIVLVIALAYVLADLTLRPMSAPAVPSAATPVERPDSPRPPAGPGRDYARMVDWQLFGPVTADAPAAPVVVDAPETRLNLRLAGIFYSDGPDGRPLALIAVDGRPEQVFRVGDTLNDGTRIARILADRVLLERNQQMEALSLPRDTVSATAARPATGAAATSSATPRQADVIDVSALAPELRQQIAANPEALQNLAYAAPYVADGRFAGLRLQPGRDPRLLGQLGLRSGDVLVELNGTRLTDPAQGALLLQDVLRADRMSARVLRDGTEIPLTFILSPRILSP